MLDWSNIIFYTVHCLSNWGHLSYMLLSILEAKAICESKPVLTVADDYIVHVIVFKCEYSFVYRNRHMRNLFLFIYIYIHTQI